MKIGILTFHAPSNFGANLQAYTSVCIYRSLGHDPQIINYQRAADFQYINTVNASQFKEHNQFVTKYLPITRLITCPNELLSIIKEENIELLSIGADAVWRAPKDSTDLVYFADWLFRSDLHIPVVAMSAAHMGNGFSCLSETLKSKIKFDLEHFSFISVRDTWTRDKINQDIMGFNYITRINPDPVIWLSDFVNTKDVPYFDHLSEKPYYLMTLPVRCNGKERMACWFNSFKKIVNSAGYSLIELPLPEGISGCDFDFTIPYPINPIHWFSYIHNAHAFCGLRFHAVISSISCGTPFFSIDSYGKTSLFISGLRKCNAYKIVKLFDTNSKIRNLLKNSKFEQARVSGEVCSIKPQKVFDTLNKISRNDVLDFRNQLRKQYSLNLEEMFNTISK